MRTLAIDTSSRACSIALLEHGMVIAERHEVLGRGHAERLIPWIVELPEGGRADRIVAGCGPGSFTGVRIGIAAAKGLALGWGVPAFGVSSLLLMVAGRREGALTAAIEGGHGEVFAQDFEGSPPRPIGEPQSLPLEDAAAAYRYGPVIGNAAAKLVAARGFGTPHDAEPRAANARFVANVHDPAPIYGRGADARPMAA